MISFALDGRANGIGAFFHAMRCAFFHGVSPSSKFDGFSMCLVPHGIF